MCASVFVFGRSEKTQSHSHHETNTRRRGEGDEEKMMGIARKIWKGRTWESCEGVKKGDRRHIYHNLAAVRTERKRIRRKIRKGRA